MLTLSVVYECAMRNFQRAPFTIRRFQRMFQPSKGQPFRVCVLALLKNLFRLGKLIEVRKRRGKDQKAKTPAKQKPGGKKKKVPLPIQTSKWHQTSPKVSLWTLNSYVLSSLPGVFKITLSGLWNFRSDFYPHQVVSIYRNFYKKQTSDEKENGLTRARVSRLSSALPVNTVPHLERNELDAGFPASLFSCCCALFGNRFLS